MMPCPDRQDATGRWWSSSAWFLALCIRVWRRQWARAPLILRSVAVPTRAASVAFAAILGLSPFLALLMPLLGGAAVPALVAKRLAGRFIAANPDVMTGIAVLVLVRAGLGSMRGVQEAFLSQPLQVLALLLLAYGLLFGVQILGTLLL